MRASKIFFLILLFKSFFGVMYCQIDNSEKKVIINFGALPLKEPSELPQVPIQNYKIKNKDFKIDLPEIEFPKPLLSLSPQATNGFKIKSPLDNTNFGKLEPKQIQLQKPKDVHRYISTQKPRHLKQFEGGKKGVFTDQYLGDIITNSLYAVIKFRDYGKVDGDIIRLLVNDVVKVNRVSLRGGYAQIKLKLKEGFNKIDFMALNEGIYAPNTAQLKIIDDNEKVLSNNNWALSTGFKATMILIKQ